MPIQLPLVVYSQQTHLPTTAQRRRVCDLPAEERPLYRLHHVGSSALATTELLALVLGTADAPGLAEELLGRFGSLHQLARTSKGQLLKVRGIGEGQAARLSAMLELSCRLQEPPAEERANQPLPRRRAHPQAGVGHGAAGARDQRARPPQRAPRRRDPPAERRARADHRPTDERRELTASDDGWPVDRTSWRPCQHAGLP